MKCLKRIVRHYWKYGQPNATIVGSPTISSGVASGFSTSSYLTGNTSKTFSAGSVSSFDIVMKIKTPTTWTSNGRIVNWNGGADSQQGPFIEGVSGNIYLMFYTGSYYILTAKTSPENNTEYFLRWVYNGTDVKSYYKPNKNDEWILNETVVVASSVIRFTRTDFTIGCRSHDGYSGCVWNGSIDLKEFHITINNERVFDGTIKEQGTPQDYDFYTDDEVSELPKKTVTTYWKTIQEYTTAGTENLNLTDGTYKIISVGGGSGGSYVKDNNDSQYKFGAVGGASGAACVAVFDLQQGSYTVTVGAGGIGRGGWFGGSYPSDPGGSTTFSKDGTDIVNCGGGAYSEAIWNYYGFQVHVGAGGTATTSGEKKIVLKDDGKSAGYATGYTAVSGAQSVYNSYGSGGSASAGGNYANAGTAGYFKILIQSDSSDYDVVETETTWYGINQ